MRIEFPADLLSELRPEAGTPEKSGVLYGLRNGCEIRVLAARLEPGETRESVGVFISRVRGEVFLTESNLGLFEQEGAAVGLVIAGGKAGFFVREADETIQTVRSYEEFPVESRPGVAPALPQRQPAAGMPKWALAATCVLVLGMLPVAAMAYLRPAIPPRPITAFSLHVEEANAQTEPSQLHIFWTSGRQALLEIKDGGERTTSSVFPDQASATYVRRTGEVEIALIPLDGDPARRESVYFVGQPPPAP